jgi:uncharacterized protein (TIGR02145 family)
MKKTILILSVLVFIASSCNQAKEKQAEKSAETVGKKEEDVRKQKVKNKKSSEESDYVCINGVKWATRNLDKPGTFADNPEDLGMLYAQEWNEETGRGNSWTYFDPVAKSCVGTKWNSNNICPKGWRIPSDEEQQSLANSGNRWITLNGINGCEFGSGDNTVFLPAAGMFYDDENKEFSHIGVYGNYLNNGSDSYGWFLSIVNDEENFNAGIPVSVPYRGKHALSVRCVAE